MPEELRADDEQIKRTPLRVGEFGLIRLGQIVDFKMLKTVEPILRDDGQRRAALMVNLDVQNVEGYVREAERRIKAQVRLPWNYIVEFGGQFKNLRESRTRLATVVIGRIVSSTLPTLIVSPVLHCWFENRGEKGAAWPACVARETVAAA